MHPAIFHSLSNSNRPLVFMRSQEKRGHEHTKYGNKAANKLNMHKYKYSGTLENGKNNTCLALLSSSLFH